MAEHEDPITLLFAVRDEARRLWGPDSTVRLTFEAAVGAGPLEGSIALAISSGGIVVFSERLVALDFGPRILRTTLLRLQKAASASALSNGAPRA